MRSLKIISLWLLLLAVFSSCQKERIGSYDWFETVNQDVDNPVNSVPWLNEAKNNLKAYLDKNLDFYNRVDYTSGISYPRSFIDSYAYQGETYYYLYIQDVSGANDPASSYWFVPIVYTSDGQVYLGNIDIFAPEQHSEDGQLFFSKADRLQRLWSYELIRSEDGCGCF
ncbi:hypothetical protein M2480_001862 [Parabacteroides sp. PFB2-12]|uniref:hypothetical protein n=1 Tax=unclassified Parabacteroides TaxID=2649774 RepID=UPI00247683E0|nr:MULTISPECIES: hypothetical protein [unclassified Parabacteroides]MDH6343525.1 hypothetical protein [Parabacteroides sp. PM6-13]MDH6390875.1 hypothetical protein [Parabacteroides sp. PFB2-12]